VCFTPFAEDYGFVTVEAFASGKPVITCHDSGGPTELVRDGQNGLVCDPTPVALSESLGRIAADSALAERLGAAARADAVDLACGAGASAAARGRSSSIVRVDRG